jgi:hypothetical protein
MRPECRTRAEKISNNRQMPSPTRPKIAQTPGGAGGPGRRRAGWRSDLPTGEGPMFHVKHPRLPCDPRNLRQREPRRAVRVAARGRFDQTTVDWLLELVALALQSPDGSGVVPSGGMFHVKHPAVCQRSLEPAPAWVSRCRSSRRPAAGSSNDGSTGCSSSSTDHPTAGRLRRLPSGRFHVKHPPVCQRSLEPAPAWTWRRRSSRRTTAVSSRRLATGCSSHPTPPPPQAGSGVYRRGDVSRETSLGRQAIPGTCGSVGLKVPFESPASHRFARVLDHYLDAPAQLKWPKQSMGGRAAQALH